MSKKSVYRTIAVTLSILLTLGAPVGIFAQTTQTSGATAGNAQAKSSAQPASAQALPPIKVTAGTEYQKDFRFFPTSISQYMQRRVPQPTLTNAPTIQSMIHDGKLDLSLEQAVRLAVENNLNIEVQRYTTWIQDTNILRTESGSAIRSAGGFTSVLGSIPTPSFDPTITSSLNWYRSSQPINNPFISGTGVSTLSALTNYNSSADFTYGQGFKTGTSVGVTFNNTRQTSTSAANFFNPAVTTSLSYTFQQQLLKGFGILPNVRYIIEARIESTAARDTLATEVMTIVGQVESAYWNLVYSLANVSVQQTQVVWAQKNLQATQAQLKIGTLAQLDVVTAQSQLATNEQALIVARTNALQAETALLNLITRDPMASGLAHIHILPTDSINTPPKVEIIPYRDAVDEAWRNRPDLLAQELGVKVDDIEVKATRNALLPTLTLSGEYSSEGLAGNTRTVTEVPTAFAPNLNAPILNANGQPITLGGQPIYAGTPSQFATSVATAQAGLLDSWDTMVHSSFPTYAFGLSLSFPLRNRSAQADSAQALLQQRQAVVNVQVLKNTIASTVRQAQIAMEQGVASVHAAEEATRLAQESLNAEQKKFQLGVATDYDVILYERDLASAQGAEIQAKANLLNSVANFNLAIGRTLQVHNITIADASSGHVVRTPLIPGAPIKPFALFPTRKGW